MNVEPGRLAAYADLVAAVLDLRGSGSRQAFDTALSDAVAAGTIEEDLARHLRSLQRASERAVVEHAEAVLPPALVALAASAADQSIADDAPAMHSAAPAMHSADQVEHADPDDLESLEEPTEPDPVPVVHLQPRRLLVAGLLPLPDPVHRGTLS